MQINPADQSNKLAKSNQAQQFNPQQAEQLAQQFASALNKANLNAKITAAEEAHKQKMRVQKDDIESGDGMASVTEEDLQNDLDKMQRKLRNILDRERKNIGL